MPDEICFVTGTGTGVGKTWVTCALVRRARRLGIPAVARKPAQSFAPDEATTDAHLLAQASDAEPHEVCPPDHWYPAAAAPPIASQMLGRPAPAAADLISALDLACDGIVFVEGVGGPRSPIALDADNVALARGLNATTVLLVSPAGLGSINATLTAAAAFPRPPIVFLNRFERGNELHELDAAWLREHSDLELFSDIEALFQRVVQRDLARSR